MISLIGIVLVFGAIAAGYAMEHGKFAVLMQPAELLIILGAAIGTLVVANPLPLLIRIGQGIAGVITGFTVAATGATTGFLEAGQEALRIAAESIRLAD